MQQYSTRQTFIANLPYIIMLLTGAGVISLALEFSAWAMVGAAAYVAYGIAGSVWIMVFICRCCGYYDSRGCPCGYGILAAKLVPKGELECFAAKFKRHIPVIVPLWLIPPACAVLPLTKNFSTGLVSLLGVFVINSFVILPLVSRRHACSECPQKEGCPWMAKEKPAA